MRRDLMMILIFAAMTMVLGCTNCNGPDVVEPGPVVEPAPPVVDGGAVAKAVVEAVTLDWAKACEDQSLTVREIVALGFNASEDGCVAGAVWDLKVGSLTLEGVMTLVEVSATTALTVGGVVDFEVLGPDVQHAEIGMKVSSEFARLIHDAMEDCVVSIGDLYKIAWGPTEIGVKEGGKWDLIVIKPTSSHGAVTLGILLSQAYDNGKAWLTVLHLWDRPAFRVCPTDPTV